MTVNVIFKYSFMIMDYFIFGIFKYSSKRFQIKYQSDTLTNDCTKYQNFPNKF